MMPNKEKTLEALQVIRADQDALWYIGITAIEIAVVSAIVGFVLGWVFRGFVELRFWQ